MICTRWWWTEFSKALSQIREKLAQICGSTGMSEAAVIHLLVRGHGINEAAPDIVGHDGQEAEEGDVCGIIMHDGHGYRLLWFIINHYCTLYDHVPGEVGGNNDDEEKSDEDEEQDDGT